MNILDKKHPVKRLSFQLIIGLLLVIFITPLSSALAGDFDDDGIPDFIIIQPQEDDSLNWTSVTSSSVFTEHEMIAGGEGFGQVGFDVAAADWMGAGSPQLAITRETEEEEIQWRLKGAESNHNVIFGSEGDSTISGADFDGNGLADAAVVDSDGLYSIRLNIFGDVEGGEVTPSTVSYEFRKRHARIGFPTFVDNNNSGEDNPAFVLSRNNRSSNRSRYVLIHQDEDGEQTRVRFAGNTRGELIYAAPISTSTRDFVLTVTQIRPKRHQVRIHDSQTGEMLIRKGHRGPGTVVIGDWLSRGYEQYGVRQPRKVTIVDPFVDGTQTVLVATESGILADTVNINSNQSGGGNGQCGVSVMRPAIVCHQCAPNTWIPRSESDGRGVFLAHNKYNGRISSVQVVRKSDCSVLGTGRFAGLHNPWGATGLRSHWRYSQTGSSFGNDLIIKLNRTNGPAIGYDLPRGGVRTEWREP